MSLARAIASRGAFLRYGSPASVSTSLRHPRLVGRSRLPTSLTLDRVAGSLHVIASQGLGELLNESRNGMQVLARQPSRSIGWFSSGPSTSTLRALEKETMNSRGDPNAEARFFVALAQRYPRQAMLRYESGQFPVNQEIATAYLEAAASTGRMDQINVSEVIAKASAAGGSGSGGQAGFQGGGQSFLSGGLGTRNTPLHVTTYEAGWRTQAWNTVRSLLGFFIIATAISSFFDLSLGSKQLLGSNVHVAETSDKRFDDVVGIDEAKAELQEIVMYLKNPSVFTRLGGKLPRGLMLTGPPGTGKTLLARAIAGEAGVPFFYSSGSEFEEMFVGVGAKRVRELFTAAKKAAPCIIFIDEIDAIGGSRHLREQQSMKMTLNQLLVEMDGFEQNSGVIVIAATNFPESLDHALTRPGRFDKHVVVPLPDVKGREAILELYGSKTKLATDTNLRQLARGTPGMSGADLFNIVNQAAIKASIDGAKAITTEALEWAKDKILMGAERKSAVISPETTRLTAYHEGGHAIVALKTPGADPVHKATVMPRGQALGMVMQLPEGDQTSMSRKQMLARMDVCMGGRVAEEMIFGHDNVTSGATSDFQQATNLARAMVTRYGMSEKVGMVFVKDHREEGDDMRAAIDAEVKSLLDNSYKRAWDCLHNNRRDLERLASALLKHESLTAAEIKDVLAGKAIRSDAAATNLQPAGRGGGAAATKVAVAAAAAKKAAASAASAATSAATRATGGGNSGGNSETGGVKGRLI